MSAFYCIAEPFQIDEPESLHNPDDKLRNSKSFIAMLSSPDDSCKITTLCKFSYFKK